MGRSGLHRTGNVILLLSMETGTSSDPVPKHIPAELRTAPSFPGNKTKFLPLNPCKGDIWTHKQMRIHEKIILTALIKKWCKLQLN